MFTIWKMPEGRNAGHDADCTLDRDVVMVLLPDGTARLLDMRGGFYGLGTVGAEMLQAALEDGVAAAVTELARRYDAPEEQVRIDLTNFLKDLQRRGMVHRGTSRSRAQTLWPSLILIPFLFLIRRIPIGKVQAVALLTLAYLSFAWFGWSRTVSVWRRCFGGPAWREPTVADEPIIKGVDETVRGAAAALPFPAACKERALCCWALTCAAGVPATLVVGLELFPLGGHCWCEAGRWTLSDDRDRCQFYTHVLRYV
jgi:hypothetical protein